MREILSTIDWWLYGAVMLIAMAGLVTMNSFAGENAFFERQIIWLLLSTIVFVGFSIFDWRFLRRTEVIIALFGMMVAILTTLFVVGSVFMGAQSWFNVGLFAIQPSDPAKLVVILLLAKYFSRRHVEIANFRHIIVSGAYVLVIFLLVFLQPDFGSAIIIASLWLGMVLVSGISIRHLVLVFSVAILSGVGLWLFAFEDYQKERIMTFLNPYTDVQGAGYNANQAMIAVGSGQILGKGIGFGTQSKLQFLPEYETDFIFAAFAEEWGFVGVTLLFGLFGFVVWRILGHAKLGNTNFEVLFGTGVAILIMSHVTVHVGMNIGLLPITGTTIPFMSYGGSHLVTEFAGLGMLMGMRRYARVVEREQATEDIQTDFNHDLLSD